MRYTKQDIDWLNNKLSYWQKMQLKAVKGNNIEWAFERMSEIDRSVWERVARAEDYKDVPLLAWELAEDVIDKYCKIAHSFIN